MTTFSERETLTASCLPVSSTLQTIYHLVTSKKLVWFCFSGNRANAGKRQLRPRTRTIDRTRYHVFPLQYILTVLFLVMYIQWCRFRLQFRRTQWKVVKSRRIGVWWVFVSRHQTCGRTIVQHQRRSSRIQSAKVSVSYSFLKHFHQ